eukprot:scaffold144056_cov29-Tisochrysis_lutea.AAC.1
MGGYIGGIIDCGGDVKMREQVTRLGRYVSSTNYPTRPARYTDTCPKPIASGPNGLEVVNRVRGERRDRSRPSND